MTRVEYQKQWRAEHKEHLRAYFRNRFIRDKDKLLAANKQRYEKNKVRILAQIKGYRERNKEHIAQRTARYQKEHPEVWMKAWSKYKAKYPERVKAAKEKYAKANPIKALMGAKRRRARLAGAIISNEQKTLVQRVYEVARTKHGLKCYYCGEKIIGTPHVDHVFAVSRGGNHGVENLAISCSKCNISKGPKPLSNWSAKGQTFLNL